MLVIEISERILRISGPGEELDHLAQILKYVRVRYDFDSAMRSFVKNPDGSKKFKKELRSLYRRDDQGNLITGTGMLDSIRSFLEKNRIEYQLVDLRKRRLEPDLSALDRFDFRPGQREVVEKILSYDRCLVCCPTAYGKSYLFTVLTRCFIKEAREIHIITRRISVADTLARYMREQGIPNVGVYHSRMKKTDSKVIICTVGSLHNLSPSADLILADEVHELATDLALEQIFRYKPLRAYGFTATPKRMDYAHRELEPIFGPLKVEISYQEAAQLGNVANIAVIWVPYYHTSDWSSMLEGVRFKRAAIWANEGRNRLLAETTLRFYQGGQNQTMVSVETVEHALRLRELLPGFETVYSSMSANVARRLISMGIATHEDVRRDPNELDRMRRDFEQGRIRGVIATRIWSTGVSFDELSVVTRADGTSSPILNTQIPGRVARVSQHKRSGVVIDILDTGDRNMYNRYLARRRNYAEHGWTQLVIEEGVVRPLS